MKKDDLKKKKQIKSKKIQVQKKERKAGATKNEEINEIELADKKTEDSMDILTRGFKKVLESSGFVGMHLSICSTKNPRIINMRDFPLWEGEDKVNKALESLKELGKLVADEYTSEIVSSFIITFDSRSKGPFTKDTPDEEIEKAEVKNTLVSIGKSFTGSLFFSTNNYKEVGDKIVWIKTDKDAIKKVKGEDIRKGFENIKGAPFDIINRLWTSYKFNTLVKTL